MDKQGSQASGWRRIIYMLMAVFAIFANLSFVAPQPTHAAGTVGMSTANNQTKYGVGDNVTLTLTNSAPAQGDKITVDLGGDNLQFYPQKTLSANGLSSLSTDSVKIDASTPGKVTVTQVGTTPIKSIKLVLSVHADLGSATVVTATLGSSSTAMTLATTAQTFPTADYGLTALSVANDGTGGTSKYTVADYPYGYLYDDLTKMYAFAYNTGFASDENANQLRKTIVNHDDYANAGGLKAQSSQTPGASFTSFVKVNADGTVGTNKAEFLPTVKYTLISYNQIPNAGGAVYRSSNGWNGDNYYMPDSSVTFSLDLNGNMTIDPSNNGDGHAVAGRYSVVGKKLQYNALKAKVIKVVDPQGHPLTGVTVNLSGMKGTQGGDVQKHQSGSAANNGSDLLVPNDFKDSTNSAKTGPFYYAAGDQKFVSLSGTNADNYALNGGVSGFTVKLDAATDKLSIDGGNNKAASVDDSGQTLTVTLQQKQLATKLVAADNANTPLSGTLNVAKVSDSGAATTPSKALTSDASGKATWSDKALTNGVYQITSSDAPAGYVADSKPYYFKYDTGSGVTAVGTDRTNLTQTSVTTSTGVTLKATGGMLVYGLPKQATGNQTITLKKVVIGDRTQGLPDADFAVTEYSAAGKPVGDSQPITTGSDGVAKLNVTNSASATAVRVFKIHETKAPDGYGSNDNDYYFTWSAAKGVINVGTDYQSATTGKLTTTADSVVAVGSIAGSTTMKELEFAGAKAATIHALMTTPGSTKTQGLAGVKVTFSMQGGSGKTLTRVTDDKGDVSLDVLNMMALTGQNLEAASGMKQLVMTVDASQAQLNGGNADVSDPAPHNVLFLPPTGGVFDGFSINGDPLSIAYNTDGSPLWASDGSLQSIDSTDSVPRALNIYLRRDALRAQDIMDPTAGVAGDYSVAFFDGATQLGATQSITVPASGTASLAPAVNAVASQLQPDKSYNVQVTHDGMTQTLTYSSTNGFSNTGASGTNTATTEYLSALPAGTATTVLRQHWQGDTVSTDSFEGSFHITNSMTGESTTMASGSQIVYQQTQSDATLTSYPEVFNFGKAEISPTAQSLPLSSAPAGDDSLATYQGTSNGLNTTLAGNNQVGATVQQAGITGQWALKVGVSDFDNTDTSTAGTTMTFKNGQQYLNGTAQTTPATTATANLGGSATTLMSATGSTPGTYQMLWQPSQIHLNLPALSGNVDKDYRATMTWTVVKDTDSHN
ncbi:SpaA isopeptide-forming pilin-related protein [Lacticaseibacillus sp. GG6-2]